MLKPRHADGNEVKKFSDKEKIQVSSKIINLNEETVNWFGTRSNWFDLPALYARILSCFPDQPFSPP